MWLSLPTSAAVAWEIFTCFLACAAASGRVSAADAATRQSARLRRTDGIFMDTPPLVAKIILRYPCFELRPRTTAEGRRRDLRPCAAYAGARSRAVPARRIRMAW